MGKPVGGRVPQSARSATAHSLNDSLRWFKTNFPKAARHRSQIDPNRSLEHLNGRPQPVTICGSIKLGLNARTGRPT